MNQGALPGERKRCAFKIPCKMKRGVDLLRPDYTKERNKREPQVQHGMGPLTNMQKSVFLPLWDNYELYGCKTLDIESSWAIESENLVRISKFFVWKEYACAASENEKAQHFAVK